MDARTLLPPVGKKKQKLHLQRYARRILGGSAGKLTTLFERASERLNVPWNGNKAHGYELLEMLYSQCRGVKGVAKNRVPSKASQWKQQEAESQAFLTSYAWRKLRMEVLIEQGRRCQCCGATPDNGVVMHVDHIKPRRLFPELALEKSNLQVLCEVCNHGKGNWDQTDWKQEAVTPESVMPMWSRKVN